MFEKNESKEGKNEKENFQLLYFYYHMVKEVSVDFPILPLILYVSGYPAKLLFLEIGEAFSQLTSKFVKRRMEI